MPPSPAATPPFRTPPCGAPCGALGEPAGHPCLQGTGPREQVSPPPQPWTRAVARPATGASPVSPGAVPREVPVPFRPPPVAGVLARALSEDSARCQVAKEATNESLRAEANPEACGMEAACHKPSNIGSGAAAATTLGWQMSEVTQRLHNLETLLDDQRREQVRQADLASAELKSARERVKVLRFVLPPGAAPASPDVPPSRALMSTAPMADVWTPVQPVAEASRPAFRVMPAVPRLALPPAGCGDLAPAEASATNCQTRAIENQDSSPRLPLAPPADSPYAEAAVSIQGRCWRQGSVTPPGAASGTVGEGSGALTFERYKQLCQSMDGVLELLAPTGPRGGRSSSPAIAMPPSDHRLPITGGNADSGAGELAVPKMHSVHHSRSREASPAVAPPPPAGASDGSVGSPALSARKTGLELSSHCASSNSPALSPRRDAASPHAFGGQTGTSSASRDRSPASRSVAAAVGVKRQSSAIPTATAPNAAFCSGSARGARSPGPFGRPSSRNSVGVRGQTASAAVPTTTPRGASAAAATMGRPAAASSGLCVAASTSTLSPARSASGLTTLRAVGSGNLAPCVASASSLNTGAAAPEAQAPRSARGSSPRTRPSASPRGAPHSWRPGPSASTAAGALPRTAAPLTPRAGASKAAPLPGGMQQSTRRSFGSSPRNGAGPALAPRLGGQAATAAPGAARPGAGAAPAQPSSRPGG